MWGVRNAFSETVMNKERIFLSLAFTLVIEGDDKEPAVITCQWRLVNHPPYGLVSQCTITIKKNKYLANVLMREWNFGELYSWGHNLYNKLAARTKYKFWIQSSTSKSILIKLGSTSRLFNWLNGLFFVLILSTAHCGIYWHHNTTGTEKSSKEVRCPACKCLMVDLDC